MEGNNHSSKYVCINYNRSVILNKHELKISDDLSSTSVHFFSTCTEKKKERPTSPYIVLTEETVPALSAYLKERGVKGVVVRPDRYPLGAEIKRGKDMKEIFWKNHTTGNLYPIR